MISKKTITFILVGIAIAAVPFFQRMQEQQKIGRASCRERVFSTV